MSKDAEIAKALGAEVRKAGFTARGAFKSKLPKKVGKPRTPKNTWAQGQQSLRGKTTAPRATDSTSLSPNVMTSHKKWQPPAGI